MKYPTSFDGDEIAPVMKGYRMACCDCGLVHTIDFEVLKVIGEQRANGFTGKPVKPGSHRVIFVASRNNRATAAKRRHRKAR